MAVFTRAAGAGLLITDEGAKYLLNCIFKLGTRPVTLVLTLLGHLSTPITSLSDTDVDMSTLQGVDAASWSSVTGGTSTGDSVYVLCSAANAPTVVGDVPVITWPVITYNFVDGGAKVNGGAFGATIYGYQILSAQDPTNVLFEELFATPFKPTIAGDVLRLTLQIQLGNGTPA